MRRGRQLLAHVAAINGGLEVVNDPVGGKALDTLVEILGQFEVKVPLMVTGTDFVCLVLAAVDGEEVDGLDKKSRLVGYGLGADRVGQVPSVVGASVSLGIAGVMWRVGGSMGWGRGRGIRDFARACQSDAHASDRYRLWVVEHELALELRLMRLGRLSIEDDKRRIGPAIGSVSAWASYRIAITYLISSTGAGFLPNTPTLGRGIVCRMGREG